MRDPGPSFIQVGPSFLEILDLPDHLLQPCMHALIMELHMSVIVAIIIITASQDYDVIEACLHFYTSFPQVQKFSPHEPIIMSIHV